MSDEKVETALQLLRMARREEGLPLSEVVEIIELVTQSPELIRQIIERGEAEGLFEREGNRVQFRKDIPLWPEKPLRIRIVRGEDRCQRCGRKITLCHYLQLTEREIGPFGSECIQRIRDQKE